MTESELLLKCVEQAIKNLVPGGENVASSVKSEIFTLYKKNQKLLEPSYVKNYKKMDKFLMAQFGRINEVEEIGIPEKENQQLRFITTSQFNAIVLLMYLIEKKGFIDEAVITVYSMGFKTLELIDRLLSENKIKKLILQASTLRMSAKDKKIMNMMKLMIKKHGRGKIYINLAWTHTKIMCMKIKDDHYVIEGSGNLSDNARIEQYLFEKSKESYEFHKDWILNVKDFSAEKDVIIL